LPVDFRSGNKIPRGRMGALDKRTPGTETNRVFIVDTLSLAQPYD
jgi:hypothetical protein